MATDPIFGWTLLVEGTANSAALVNELLARIVAGTIRVLSLGDNTPPGSPANFDAYILGGSPTGAWSGQANKIAVYADGWKFMTPTKGMRLRVADDNYTVEYDGSAWRSAGSGFQTLTDAATINWDVSLGLAARVTLTDNRTMAAPTNLVEGQTYVLHVIQDGTGNRTLTWNAAFLWPSGTAPTLTTTASREDVFRFQCRNGKLYGSTTGLNYTP